MSTKHTAAARPEAEPVWFKSSHSGSGGGACIEVANGGAVRVRDSKDPSGPVLTFGPEEWTAFVRFAAGH